MNTQRTIGRVFAVSYRVLRRRVCTSPAPVTLETLLRADDTTSNAVIAMLEDNRAFARAARLETESIIARDMQDSQKLEKGIEIAQGKALLPSEIVEQTPHIVDVSDGKSAEQVAEYICSHLGQSAHGRVVVLQGLSGTGKGTTARKLQGMLSGEIWSNGDIFRALTLLVLRLCEQQDTVFSPQILTPELLERCMAMLEFGEFSGGYDTRVTGLGLDCIVSEVSSTLLKSRSISSNISTVAHQSQGEVLTFATAALQKMRRGGFDVIVEGRAQTLRYVPTPHRYELVMTNSSLLGKRRLAQRIAAHALEQLRGSGSWRRYSRHYEATDVVEAALLNALRSLPG